MRGEIVFQHIDRGRGWGIYVVPRAGMARRYPSWTTTKIRSRPPWSPDGRAIVYSSLADSFTFDLQVVDRDGGEYTRRRFRARTTGTSSSRPGLPDGITARVRSRADRPVAMCPRGDLWLADYDPALEPVRTFSPSSRTSETFATRAGRQTAGSSSAPTRTDGSGCSSWIRRRPSPSRSRSRSTDWPPRTPSIPAGHLTTAQDRVRIAGSFQPCAPEKWATWPSWGANREIRVLTLSGG